MAGQDVVPRLDLSREPPCGRTDRAKWARCDLSHESRPNFPRSHPERCHPHKGAFPPGSARRHGGKRS
ncbi:hypothetical protein FRAAL6291 [Frankia alni ACN14a]|uniref:Uncharacterized protein n=1 Tax=Frankia alni (strain DSM 45986 / CECT 9034 / ACN14a) TaxID=326424 RepID=Q0RCB3_FRAAA|nr:hypothetical protein FRAAL6291 [Frankia alni ACN14a]